MAQPSLQDLLRSFDPTGFATITGAGLAQLADGLSPFGDKGLVVITTDIATNPQVPDAVTHTKWASYLWVRRSVSSAAVYVWDPSVSSDPTFLNWRSITLVSLADGSVTNSKIAAGAVTDDKIFSLDWFKLTSVPVGLMYGGVTVAGGDLTGLYPNPTIAANAVTGPKLQSDATVDANRAVGTDHIKDASVTPAKLSAVALGQFMPIGSIVAFSATTIPANWAECNGAAVLRASYPDLHTLYSLDTYPWSANNGVTTFNLPNLMGYFLRSRSADAAVDPDGPRAIANVQADKVKTHTHDIVIGNDTAVDTQQTLAVQGDNTVHTTFTSSNQTPAGATETRPKNVAVIYIVKVL